LTAMHSRCKRENPVRLWMGAFHLVLNQFNSHQAAALAVARDEETGLRLDTHKIEDMMDRPERMVARSHLRGRTWSVLRHGAREHPAPARPSAHGHTVDCCSVGCPARAAWLPDAQLRHSNSARRPRRPHRLRHARRGPDLACQLSGAGVHPPARLRSSHPPVGPNRSERIVVGSCPSSTSRSAARSTNAVEPQT